MPKRLNLKKEKQWRATPEERRAKLPGDELIWDAGTSTTHAITIHAPAVDVWPWLVQMGCDRAGFYSYDRLDNGGVPSAMKILPQYQKLRLGDILPSRPGSEEGFQVLRIETNTLLLLGSYLGVPGFRNLPWDADHPAAYMQSTWLFLLQQQGDATRLIVRFRNVVKPRAFGMLLNTVMRPAHVIMQRKQLLNLRKRAEKWHAKKSK
jgi:hypothetical protein